MPRDQGWMDGATEATDEQEFARVAAGDRLAFARLVTRHRGRITAVAARIVGDRAAAEDIAQETFLRAWVKAPGWVGPERGGTAKLTTWLSRIAVNLSLDGQRRRPHLPLDGAPEPIDGGDGAEQAMLTRERDHALAAAVAALPDRQRAAVALTYDQGLDNAAGAAAMGITVGAFELLLVRARRTLRNGMKGDTA